MSEPAVHSGDPGPRPYVKDDKVTIEDLDLASEWLRTNDGDLGEADSCHRVADLLQRMINQRNTQAGRAIAIRRVAKDKGVTPADVRKALRRARG